MIRPLTNETMTVDTYLERIDYSGPREPTMETLRQLHRAHMFSVPFENLDIHLGHPIHLSLPAFYDKIVRRRRGGFCYELNGLFGWLLTQVGFEVITLSARVFKGIQPGREFDHMLLLVQLEEPLIADVGFGDSFLEPLPLHSGVENGRLYRFTESQSGKVLERRRGAEWEPQYVFSLKPRRLVEFSAMCHYQQTSPHSHFTQKTVCSMATANGRITLSNNRLIVTTGEQRQEREIKSADEVRALLQTHFGITLGEGERMDRLMVPATRT